MAKLEFPKVDTYFIAWNNEKTEIEAYGLILTNQVMETLLIQVDYYTEQKEYLRILINNGIETNIEI